MCFSNSSVEMGEKMVGGHTMLAIARDGSCYPTKVSWRSKFYIRALIKASIPQDIPLHFGVSRSQRQALSTYQSLPQSQKLKNGFEGISGRHPHISAASLRLLRCGRKQ